MPLQESMMTDVIPELRRELSSLRTGTSNLCSFSGLPEMSFGFFPGGNGLFDGSKSQTKIPVKVMVLGSNFGCRAGFVNSGGHLLVDDERNSPTWRPLLKTLLSADVDVNECFFTNAWPFLHHGEGNLPRQLIQAWLSDPILMSSCIDFFGLTFQKILPSLVVALGIGPAAFLGHVWADSLHRWRGCSISSIDALPSAAVEVKGHLAECVAITHPSMPNSWRRRAPYQNRTGEARLLREALMKAIEIR
jgi:hypothetical protein